MSFQEALQARLELMNVSRETLEAFLADHPPRLSKGAVSCCSFRHRTAPHASMTVLNPWGLAEWLEGRIGRNYIMPGWGVSVRLS